MNASKRRQNPGHRTVPTIVADSRHGPDLDRTAALIRAELSERGADCVPFDELAKVLHFSRATLRATVARYPDLGIGGSRERSVVWAIAPAAIAAGFEPVYTRGRMVLRLGTSGGPPWPLIVSGQHLGPAHHEDIEPGELGTYGYGELGYTVARLSMMARRWLVLPGEEAENPEQLTLRLFELIATAWQTSPGPVWFSGRLHAHQTDLSLPVGTRFWHQDALTSRLELVVWADRNDGFMLVNVYPAGTYRSIFGTEES